MSPSVTQVNGNMAFRGNRNRGNFGGGYNNGPMGNNRMNNMSPWESQNAGGNFGGSNMRQGGQNMNAQALNLANNLLNNLFRNQTPPSLLDLPRGGNMGNRNRGGPMVNRSGGGGNRPSNRRPQGGFQNRGAAGAKSAQKQGNGGGIRKQNAIDRARKLLAKNANNKKKDAASSGDRKTESKESLYANIHNDMFYCHLCKKHMWDAISFENHIKGRTHLMMREGIEESYRLKANMIRQEAKIAEQLKSIELDRLKSMGKSKQRNLDYCTMCDLNFHGHISTHRKSDGHLQLKKFLHPKCTECNKEFPTRIDYDTHLLSPDHLKIASEKNVKVGETKRQTLPILTEEDELKDVRPPQKKRKRSVPAKKDGANSTADGDEDAADLKKEDGDVTIKTDDDGEDSGEKKDDAAGEDGSGDAGTGTTADETKDGDDLNENAAQGEAEEEEEVPLPVDPEDCILDYNEGDEIPIEIDIRLPKYNWTRPVGTTLITKLECYECSLCGKYFDTDKTVEVHSRTVTHHRNFLKFINEKSSYTKFAQKRAAAALEENERKKRKLEEAEAAAVAGAENGDEANASGDGEHEGEGDEGTANGEGELYDPSQATGEDEDAEMNENGDGEENEADGGEAEENGAEAEEMETQEVAPQPKPEPVPVPAVVVQQPEPKKPATPKVEPAKSTPVKQAPATPAAAPSPAPAPAPAPAPVPAAGDESPAKKATPARTPAAARNTPRGRGRGRYTRY